MATPLTEWTEPRIEQLNRLWNEGWSASIIARKIGGTSRNAVIGKVHRLGLPSRVARVRATPNRRLKPRKPLLAEPWRAKTVFEYQTPGNCEPDSRALCIEDLTAITCHWPHGDPKGNDFGFCGHPVAPGSSYCVYHHRKARQ